MKTGTVTFIVTTAATVIGWVMGTIAVGFSTIVHQTKNGVVDMTNAYAIQAAINDPTFTLKMSWGPVAIYGQIWPILLPVMIGLTLGIMSYLIRKRSSKQ